MRGVKVYGISVVRDEADIIGVSVAHHLSQGLDRIIVLDNGSTDGTDEILWQLAEGDERVRWRRDESPFDQAALTTALAREAHRLGADWVLPFDADEFWLAEGGDLKKILAASRAGTLSVEVVNFVQARRRTESTTEGLLDMTRRVAHPTKPGLRTRTLVESHRISYIEMIYPPKWISRTAPEMRIYRGNHKVEGVEGAQEKCEGIVCLHAVLRSRAVLESRVGRRIRLEEAGIGTDSGGWHIAHWTRASEKGMMEQEWAANSYEDGYLDVYGERHNVVVDFRLRDVVAPHVSGGPSVVKRMLTGAVKRLGRRVKRAIASMRSMGSAKKELEETKQRLKQTTRNLRRAEQRIERLVQRHKEANRQLREAARDHLLHEAPKGAVCAEIGVHEGEFSKRILDTVKPERLHLIDPWMQGEGLFGKQAAREQATVEERYTKVREQFADEIEAGQVRVHRALSSEVAEEFDDLYFDLVYVDGNHLYEYVKQDLELYYPKVKAGGYVAGDDYGNPGYWDNGVQKAVDEFVSRRPEAVLEVKATQFIIRKKSVAEGPSPP